MNSMKLAYDDKVGAAYIRLQTDEENLQSAAQKVVRLSDSAEADDVVVLDLDDAGRVIGIEFVTADDRLLPSILHLADRGST